MTIAAIPTRVNGRNFRSRLEARWSLLLDALGWRFEYEPEGLARYRIFDFVLTEFEWPTVLEAKPAFTIAEFEGRRTALQHQAREWILDELQQRRKFFDELPEETVSLAEYDEVLADIERVERGEDALHGRRAIVVGSTLHNNPVWDGASVDGMHHVLACGRGYGLGRIGERCLRCGIYNHSVYQSSHVLSMWLATGDATQWRAPA